MNRFSLFMGGAEATSHRKRLVAAGVEHLAVNFAHLKVPAKKRMAFSTFGEASILLYLSDEEMQEEYEDFVAQYHTRFDHILTAQLSEFWLDIGADRVVPIVGPDTDLETVCADFTMVAVTDEKRLTEVRSAARTYQTGLVGLSLDKKVYAAQRLSAAISGSWTSVERYGETQIWDGRDLRRYEAKNREKAVSDQRAAISQQGYNPELVLEDTPAGKEARITLAIWSWQQWAGSLSRKGRRREPNSSRSEPSSSDGETPTEPYPDPGGSAVDRLPRGGGTTPAGKRQQKKVLPTMAVSVVKQSVPGQDAEGNAITETIDLHVATVSSGSLRVCDTCFLRNDCPEFSPSMECAYDLPVKLTTKDQLDALMNGMIEMQTHRVAFLRMIEEVQGGAPDQTLSAEMDRWWAMVKKAKDIREDGGTLRVNIEAKGDTGVGVVGRIFGSHASEKARELPGGGIGPEDTDEVARQFIDVKATEPSNSVPPPSNGNGSRSEERAAG